MAQNKKSVERKSSAVGLGAATLAAAMAGAAGAYWLYGSPDAAKHRKSAKSFMLKARADVLEAVEKINDVDKQGYLKIVDGVVKRYSSVAGITSAEIAQMTRDLKATWTHMHAVRAKAKAAEKASSAAQKKTVKKSPTKKK